MAIQIDSAGKIADPAARAAAQALLACFVRGQPDDENERAWLAWALRQPPGDRLEVYLIVWRVYLKMPEAKQNGNKEMRVSNLKPSNNANQLELFTK